MKQNNELSDKKQCAINGVTHSFKVGDVVELEVYGELCCEECNEVIHNHIDCPVCKDGYADTDQYIDLYEETQLQCEKCETVYKKVSENWYGDCRAEIVSLNCG
jgi:hypothetical protein